MKLRIFHREESFFDLFEAAADNMAQSARLLDDLLGDFVDPELKANAWSSASTKATASPMPS
jgi:hypothetical protein